MLHEGHKGWLETSLRLRVKHMVRCHGRMANVSFLIRVPGVCRIHKSQQAGGQTN